MAENEDENEIPAPDSFRGEEALAKAREGKDAWNAWVKENPGRAVNFFDVDFKTEENKGISFNGFIFPGNAEFFGSKFLAAKFDGAVFKEKALFLMAHVEGDASFIGTVFNRDAQFTKTQFKGEAFFKECNFFEEATFVSVSFNGVAAFNNTTFKKDAGFGGTIFNGPVTLNGSHFLVPPDFRRSEFKKHVTLDGIRVDFQQPAQNGDADLYRRLKEIAINARDHDREQMFFAYELLAKRGHETHGLTLVPNYLYGWFSDFGRSLGRPGIGLVGVWFGFGVLYRGLATKDMSHLGDGLLFSSAHLFPFLGASKGALADAKAALFGDAALDALVNALGMLEGALGILFLFLIGLALRNRFRL